MPNEHLDDVLLQFFLHFSLRIDAKRYDVGRFCIGNAYADVVVEGVSRCMREGDASQNAL